jgi:hypothetical protein
MGARHYDPATGRFLQPDPLGIAASELYAYAANNPYVFWDSTGLAPVSFSGGGFLSDPRFGGALQLAGGIGEAALGAAACGSVAGCAVGAVAFVHGVDHAYAGASTLYSGSSTQTYTNQALQYGGVPAEYAGYADAAIGVASGVGAGRYALGLGVGFAEGSSGLVGGASSWTRVGRWMGQAEYDAMLETRAVQVGGGNTTYVTRPANIESYLPRARPGDLYVEFNVPPAALRPAGRADWAQIPGPGHRLDRLNPIPHPVPAWDLEHLATRIGK